MLQRSESVCGKKYVNELFLVFMLNTVHALSLRNIANQRESLVHDLDFCRETLTSKMYIFLNTSMYIRIHRLYKESRRTR